MAIDVRIVVSNNTSVRGERRPVGRLEASMTADGTIFVPAPLLDDDDGTGRRTIET
jgi:hypothetical protein